MDCTDLTPDQAERLFMIVSRDIEYLHRLLARMRAAGFPAEDPLHRACRNAVEAGRALYLSINDHRRNGVQRRALRRSQLWPPL